MHTGVTVILPDNPFTHKRTAASFVLNGYGKTLDEMKAADEIFTTSSGALIKRADRIDGEPAGMRDEETFRALHKALWDEFFAETD